MKIALFVHCFFPEHFYGTETYTLELATNLRAMGHEPVIVTAVFQDEPKGEQAITRYEYAGLTVYCFDKNYCPYTGVGETYYQPAVKPFLREILATIQPDLVHVTHLANHSAALLEVVKEFDLPVVATLTDFFGFCFTNKLETADGSLCSGPNTRRTNCLVCLLKSEALLPAAGSVKRLAGRYPWAKAAAELLWLVAHTPIAATGRIGSIIKAITERPDLLLKLYSTYQAVIAPSRFLHDAYVANGLTVPVHLSRFGTDIDRHPKPARTLQSPLRFGFIGQIAPHKGTDILVEAFCRLPADLGELYIYGPEGPDPVYMARLKSRAQGFAVSFRGTFPKEKLAEVFAELDFLVIPSTWYENSPLVLLNALASHTPAIVADVAGMTEFVTDGWNGYIFSRGSVADLERVMQKAVREPEKARAMIAATEYLRTTRMMAEDVVALYKTVINNRTTSCTG